MNKYFRYACIALSLSFLVSFSTVFSQNKETPVNFNFYGSFAHTERLPNALFFFSEIRDKDSFYFRKALRNHKISFIVLASPGGSVFEALQIAAIINDKESATFVPEVDSGKPEICASACAFMLLAGKERKVNGRLGVHQFLSTSDKQRKQPSAIQQTTQFTVSEIIGFLNEFKTPPWVFEKMFYQREMYFFNKNEIQKLETNVNDDLNDFFSKAETLLREYTQSEGRKNENKSSGKTLVSSEAEGLKVIQRELNRIGCSAGPVDGKLGPRTLAAIKSFSKKAKIQLKDDPDLFVQRLFSSPENYCPKLEVKKNLSLQERMIGTYDGKLRCGSKNFPAVLAVGRTKIRNKFEFTLRTDRYRYEGKATLNPNNDNIKLAGNRNDGRSFAEKVYINRKTLNITGKTSRNCYVSLQKD